MNNEELTKLHKRVFGTSDGKELYEHLMNKYYHKQSYVKADKEHTSFRQGQWAVMSDIRKHVNKKL